MSPAEILTEIQLLHPDFQTFTYGRQTFTCGRCGLSFQQYHEDTLVSQWTHEEFNPRSRTRQLMDQLLALLENSS